MINGTLDVAIVGWLAYALENAFCDALGIPRRLAASTATTVAMVESSLRVSCAY